MNQLRWEISPYLLQHAGNPVDWQPWGPAALGRARAEEKPIFLSIGYSACHWCHVMAHESFENGSIAELLTAISSASRSIAKSGPIWIRFIWKPCRRCGQGGWPMSVFLTPEQKPFFGGTYWPPRRGGMAGFADVVAAVAAAWRDRRNDLLQQAEKIVQYLRTERLAGDKSAELNESPWKRRWPSWPRPSTVARAASARRQVSPRHRPQTATGPLAGPTNPKHNTSPKRKQRKHTNPKCSEAALPPDSLLEMVVVTLDRMAAGGIYDHLGGGFHRYSVDAEWLVPHFEKMLYDNAMLADCYLAAWQATGRNDYLRVVRETLDYVLRDMTDPLGGFYSAEDADSEGEEGKFYVWTPEEVQAVLGPKRAAVFCHVYDVTTAGNFDGRNILHLPKPIAACARSSAATRGTGCPPPPWRRNWPPIAPCCSQPGPAAYAPAATTRCWRVGTG